ncbi:MAG: hypothetical protein NWS71_03785 [Opitutales bacterium]|jgi:hypothetical protein|nr:hypothetical protein [Opitutales bacterium]MDP4879556.1 hypothetical protein [Opitutales bacterium]
MDRSAYYNLGESGMDAIRFGGQTPVPDQCQLAHLIPLLMRIANKSRLGLYDLSGVQFVSMMEICAGSRVKVVPTVELAASILVDFVKGVIEVSQDDAGGLRDAIFAAVMLRVFNEEPALRSNLAAMLDEVKLRLLDELPQVLTYSGSSELKLSMLEDGRLVIKTNRYPRSCALPYPLKEKVVEEKAIMLSAA